MTIAATLEKQLNMQKNDIREALKGLPPIDDNTAVPETLEELYASLPAIDSLEDYHAQGLAVAKHRKKETRERIRQKEAHNKSLLPKRTRKAKEG